MVFVPLIYATSIILAGLVPPIPLASNLPKIYLSDFGVAVYAIGYFLLEPIAGTLMLPFLLGCGYYARVLPTQFPSDVVAKYAATGNLASWIAQFMGHGLAEGRAPALLDNLFQVFCSPLRGLMDSRFTWRHCLFGWRLCLLLDIVLRSKSPSMIRSKQINSPAPKSRNLNYKEIQHSFPTQPNRYVGKLGGR